MPTRVRDDVQRQDVAHSQNDIQVNPTGHLLVTAIVVDHPEHLVVGQSYRLIDAHHPNGISARLDTRPGGGKMTATFTRN